MKKYLIPLIGVLLAGCQPVSQPLAITDTLNDGLKLLISTVEKVAPLVWQAYVQRAYAEGIANTVWAVVSAIVSVLVLKLVLYLWKEAGKKDAHGELFGYVVFAVVVFLSSLLVMLANISNAVMTLGAPEYHAIQLLIQSVK